MGREYVMKIFEEEGKRFDLRVCLKGIRRGIADE
jgi:hypothetical protein